MFSFLARLILITVAVSVIRSVLRFVSQWWAGTQAPRSVPRQSQGTSSTASSAERGQATVLQQDPVCGTFVAIDSSLKRIVSGRVYHFCSPECRDRFQG